jgi:hypothetical protein
MVVVTDKQYYIDESIKERLDYCINRRAKNFDHLFIVDGDEGYGKSTATIGWAYYVAYTLGLNFTHANVFFNPDDLLKFAGETDGQVIVWDEAALGGLSVQWQSKIQQQLVQMLMVARKKRHFWFFVIPKFFRLNEYVVVDRSIGLIHVYSQDDLNRGNFVYFDKRKKNKLYYEVKKTKIRNYKNYTFRGKFVQKGFVIDEQEYDKQKEIAIKSIFEKDKKMSDKEIKLIQLKYKLATLEGKGIVEISKFLDIPERTLYGWRYYEDKYPEIIEKSKF